VTRFVARRLASMALVLVAVSFLTFLIFNVIPGGDPAVRMAGRAATDSQIEAIREDWGFDRGLLVQYAETMEKLFTADLVSYFTREEVVEEILARAPRTLALALGAAVLWMAGGIAAGVYGAVRAGRPVDRAITALALVAVSVPVFWLAALASHYLGFRLGAFPNGGYVPFADDPLDWAHHLVLPWVVLALGLAALYSRIMRANVLDALGEDYVRAARAKGISERRVLSRHVLRNSVVPLVSLWGLDFAAVVGGGAILVESIFDLGGVGQYAASGIDALDVPVVLGVTLFAAFFIVVLNAIADIAHAALDPRVAER
jgi:peptide/nickel transport system permease protein